MKKIFYNGTIITMENKFYVQAVMTDNGVIDEVGYFDDLMAMAPEAELIDLKHRTLLPAFIDTHGHFSSYANGQLQVDLDGAESFDEIEKRIVSFIVTNNIKENAWITANGYDHNMLAERRHPNKVLLDNISPINPLILQHQSGHCGVLNTKAMEILGITLNTESPVGGVIGRSDGELTGYMEETAYIQAIRRVPMSDMETMLSAYGKAQDKYMSYGITTVQDGYMVSQMMPLYKLLVESGILKVDIVGYPDIYSMKDISAAFPKSMKKYDKHFKIGGYKIMLDGSPQVRTAWMKAPYVGGHDCGYGTMSDTDVIDAVEKSVSENIQILAHCNGDAAIQQYIDAVKSVASMNEIVKNLKPVIIHAQLMSEFQLEEAARLNMIPSFFIAHILHWGDTHVKNFGYERAKSISPANSALKSGIVFTFHQDAPVIEPNMLETIQCAVTRKTKTEVVLGEKERIEVTDALKAVTINAAYQYSEEAFKGSIKKGKCADFVILSDNPLTVPKDTIKDIVVIETIKDGQTVYKR